MPRVSGFQSSKPLKPEKMDKASVLLSMPAMVPAGVDLLSLDGLRAVRCLDAVAFPEVRRFLRVAKWIYKVGRACKGLF